MSILAIGIVAFVLFSQSSYNGRAAGCDASVLLNESSYITNGGFEAGLEGWSAINTNKTALITTDNPHCGKHALELVTSQGATSSGIALRQVMKFGQCSTPGGTPFGLAVNRGLKLSAWDRTPNATQTRFGVSVVFHNGTSKLSVDYALAYKGTSEASFVAPDLHMGSVFVIVNSSTGNWKQDTFDLYADFMKYFGVDSAARHYCVNYIALWQTPVDCANCGTPPVTATSTSYSFFDDIQLGFQR